MYDLCVLMKGFNMELRIRRHHALLRFIRVFIALYPILPVYFALNISSSLPLISAGRILLMILIFLTFLHTRKRIKYEISQTRNTRFVKLLIYGMAIYSIAQIMVSLAHFTSSALNNIFTLTLERILLFYCLSCWVNTTEKVKEAINILVLVSGVVCLLAITEPFTKTNLAYFLDTAGRDSVLKAGYYRSGMLRAEFTFGHPLELGLYTVLIFPFTIHLAAQKKKAIYWMIAALNILANILSFSRSTITILLAVIIVMMFLVDKKTKYSIIKLIFSCAVLGIFAIFFANGLLDIIINIINETLAAFGLGSAMDNFKTIAVRTTQWSVLNDVLRDNPVFGAGINYINDNIVYYTNSNGNRGIMKSIDCEYLEQIIEGGIVGVIGFISLFGSILKTGFSKKLKKNPLVRIFLVSFIGCLGCYISVSELKDSILWTFIALFLGFVIADGKEAEEGIEC